MGRRWCASSACKARSNAAIAQRGGKSPPFRPIGIASERHGQAANRHQAPCAAALSRHARRSAMPKAFAGVLREAVARRRCRRGAAAAQARRRARPDQPRQGAGRRSCSRSGAALMLDGHAEIAARAGADGAHLTGIEAFTAAVDEPEAGAHRRLRRACTPGTTPCSPAERGADYVMFGEPEAGGRRPSFAAIVERIEWWAEAVRDSVRRLCRDAGRGRTARRGRRRFRRHRRDASGTTRAGRRRRSPTRPQDLTHRDLVYRSRRNDADR